MANESFADLFQRDETRGPCQLYLISPLEVDGGFPDRLARALDAGPVAAFQFRVKGGDQHRAAALAEPLQAICRARDVAFIVNDSIALAKRIGADGVHLGQDDGDPREARRELGPGAQIGVTCHDSKHLAMEAGEASSTSSVLASSKWRFFAVCSAITRSPGSAPDTNTALPSRRATPRPSWVRSVMMASKGVLSMRGERVRATWRQAA